MRFLPYVFVVLSICWSAGRARTAEVYSRQQLTDAVRDSFLASHEGWSTDEVLLNDRLQARFIALCQQKLPGVEPKACNTTLMNLRKAGKLGPVVTRRRHDRHDQYQHVAEIAARLMYDKHQLTFDQVLCDPDQRKVFDTIARSMAPRVEPYLLRKAALGLRKARRLRPELVVRIADWGRQIDTLTADQIVAGRQRVPERPGIYIFRDSTGYLYIGQSVNLRTRVLDHLDASDRQSLANYLRDQGITGELTVELHSFDPDSKARETMVRRAYESELIGSRKPRFNLHP